MFYTMTIAGVTRDLPLCRINDSLYIAAFVLLGDVELTKCCAAELVKKAPEHDIIVTAESKGIPLVYEMASLLGHKRHIIVRKSRKLYMPDVISTTVNSITTENRQELFLDTADAEYLKNKRVLIVDDVISTGNSLSAVERLIDKAGGTIVGKMAVLAEGDAQERDDIIYLEKLPVFNADGSILFNR